MKYIIDEALIVESAIEEEVNESSGKKEKNYYIQGIFSTPGQQNRNGRIYPMQIWEREVAKYQEHIKNNTMNTLGEWEHPSRVSVDPLEAVMKIVELKMDNGVVVGKAKILNNGSHKTNQLKALIDEGYKIGVSSRGTGSIKGNIVENFSLTTYDAVSSPSDYNANLTGLCESLENSVKVESGDIKEIEIKPEVQETKQEEIVEAIEVQESKELTLEEKKIAAEKVLGKFQDIFGCYNINEGFKVNSKLASISTLQMLEQKLTDEKQKNMINAVIDFLSKEFNLKQEK